MEAGNYDPLPKYSTTLPLHLILKKKTYSWKKATCRPHSEFNIIVYDGSGAFILQQGHLNTVL